MHEDEQLSLVIIPQDQLRSEVSGPYAPIYVLLERNTPELTQGDLDHIADRVSQQLRKSFLTELPQQEGQQFQQRMKKLAYDIGVGLTSSGIWGALVYAVSQVLLLDGPPREDNQLLQRQQWMREVRSALTRDFVTVDADADLDLDDLDFITRSVREEFASGGVMRERILCSPEFQRLWMEVEERCACVGVKFGSNFLALRLGNDTFREMVFLVQERIVAPEQHPARNLRALDGDFL